MIDRPPTRLTEGGIDHKEVRKINPEGTRQDVLEHIKTSETDISRTAAVLGIDRTVDYDIIGKGDEGDLEDR